MKKHKYKKQPRTEEIIEDLSFENLSDGFHKEIISLFHHISKPFKNGEGEKEKAMLELLKPYDGEYVKDMGILIPSKTEKPRITVVSHIDLIPTFNKGFEKDKIYRLGKINGKEIIAGALDNTLTNAVVMHAIFHLRSKGLAEDVEFIFTEDEETDSDGMIQYLKQRGTEQYFINLDVTNDAQGHHMSIEYDKPNWSICKQINDKFNAGFTTDRVCDDMDEVIRKDGRGYSYCIPTWKTIHSYKNYTYIDNIVPYFEGLLWMITEMDISDTTHDFKFLSMKKALKCSTKEKLDKKELKAKEKRPVYKSYEYKEYTHTNNYPKYEDWTNDFEMEDNWTASAGRTFYDYGRGVLSEEEMIEQFSDFDDLNFSTPKDLKRAEQLVQVALNAAEDYDAEIDEDIQDFILSHLIHNREWNIDDLCYSTNIENAEKLISAWDDYYIIDKIDEGVYRFSGKKAFLD